MKAKLIREMIKVERSRDSQGRKARKTHTLPVGAEIEDPKAFRLVQMGCAVAADEECETAAGMTPEKTQIAQAAFDRVRAGIHPEDYEAYGAGLMKGYKPDGQPGDSWIPGPNWAEGCEEEYYQSGDDDE